MYIESLVSHLQWDMSRGFRFRAAPFVDIYDAVSKAIIGSLSASQPAVKFCLFIKMVNCYNITSPWKQSLYLFPWVLCPGLSHFPPCAFGQKEVDRFQSVDAKVSFYPLTILLPRHIVEERAVNDTGALWRSFLVLWEKRAIAFSCQKT